MPFILMYCNLTNEKITDALEMDVSFIFYIVSYEILRRKQEKKELDRIYKQHKR